MTIGSNIKKLRTSQGLTQDQLAERLFVTRQTVSNWERGASQPDLEQLEAIAAALGVEVTTILYGRKAQYRPGGQQIGLALGMLLLVLGLCAVCWKLGPWCERQLKLYGGLIYYFLHYYVVILTAVLGGITVVLLAGLRWPLLLEPREKWICRAVGLLLLSCLLLGPISLPWMSYVDPYAQGWEGNLTVFLYWCYERGVTGLHAILTGALLCLGCKKAKLEGKEAVS